MKTRLEKLLPQLQTIAYYVMGLLLLTGLVGYFLDYQNTYWNTFLKAIMLLYGESLFLCLVALKIYDLKDNIKQREYSELLPFGQTNLTYFFLYVTLGVSVPILISQCN